MVPALPLPEDYATKAFPCTILMSVVFSFSRIGGVCQHVSLEWKVDIHPCLGTVSCAKSCTLQLFFKYM